MLKRLSYILILLLFVMLGACRATKALPGKTTNENLIIYYSPDCGNTELLSAAEKYGSKVLYVYKNINGIAVTVPNGKTVLEAMKYYEKVNGVLSVVQDQKMQLD